MLDIYISNSPEETFKFAVEFAKKLKGNEKLLLYGELGAGKTLFIQGLAYGLGMKNYMEVCSPSFVLIKEYKINEKNFYHIDLYRIQEKDDAFLDDLYELLYSDELIAVEWAEKIKNIEFPHIRIFIEYQEEQKRKITIEVITKNFPSELEN